MVDTLTPAERSERMSRIRSSDTSPELSLRKALHRFGLRYTLANRDLPGKPDIVFRRKRVAVFVHGCFWHRHENCKVANMPKSNTAFWQAKFGSNVARDQRARTLLEELDWRVEVVWECELGPKTVARTAERVMTIVKS
ncbi:very short patch repair endonuclease [Mesorhizobium tianshanense]|uniref:Very short patch repair endonuclease n=1 Tax=Mesorhizobium tianshanense TaxID=39844 RepID=A0A562MAY0_9HYPH|nr:very short patch repair endonuclease [Mesorhizobium tianshanense]TWI17053.1 T/G mismatch-specific endonuclease [Mesorhizobium tianshanense]GLS35790.1 very short patch repair endonuclease [Mesorhizobium tianshanense]